MTRGDRSLMGRSLSYAYAAGSLMMLVSVVNVRAEDKAQLVVAATGGLLFAVILAVVEKLPMWVLQASVALGSVLVEIAVHATHGESPVYTVFYFWIAIYAFYFFSRLAAIAQLLFVFCSYAWVAGLAGDPRSPASVGWMLTTAALVVAGALVGMLRHRMDMLLDEAASSAVTDGLTGVRNRRQFEEQLRLELARATRAGRGRDLLSLLIIDADHFKSINDSFGHQEGDRALRRLADYLQTASRIGDTVARIGGEEFAVIMPQSNEREAYVLAERIRKGIALATEDETARLTVSIGIATYPHHAEDMASLMRAADQALYLAKGLGRDRTVIYSTAAKDSVSAAMSRSAAAEQKHLERVISLAQVLDHCDSTTAVHSQTVARYAKAIAEQLGLDRDQCERIRYAGLVHDLGKVGIPQSVLRKPGPLDDQEYAEVKRHPEIGARLLAGADLDDIANWVLAHHERPDGNGYPYGLSGDQIPLEGRILAVADAFEAMTSGRVYQPPRSVEEARMTISEQAGRQFDEAVVEAFLRLPPSALSPAPGADDVGAPAEQPAAAG